MIHKGMAKIATAVSILGAASCVSPGDDLRSSIDDPGSVPATSPPTAPTPTVESTATRITIKSTQPLALVAFREVTDPVWHLATEKTSGEFVARVRGPYWLTTVCQAAQPGTPVLFTQVWRSGHTLDESNQVDVPFVCAFDAPSPLPRVTGLMVQPGTELGTVALSSAPFSAQFSGFAQQFPFSLLVSSGTYKMYGFDDDRIVIRPDVVVDHSLPVFPLDLTIEGTRYAFTSFNVLNADPLAFLHAVTRIEDGDAQIPFQLADLPLPGKVVPNEAMTNDNQTVSVQGDVFTFDQNVFRQEKVASRRPWRLGDDPTFGEPTQITGATWLFDGRGQLITRWRALPPNTIHVTEVSGFTSLGDFVDDTTEMSPAFLAQTGITSTLVDTSIPGFQPDWIVAYNSPASSYTRFQISQNVTDPNSPEQAPIFTSSITEFVFPQLQLASREAVAALPAQPHMPRLSGMPYPR
jgi:hypothetical protein